jgi:acyl-CoA synthetase (AMP-forming)/AMP-acid ligase II
MQMGAKSRSIVSERRPAATLAETLAGQAEHRPNDTACRFIEPGDTSLADSTVTTLSFADLARRAAAIASSLNGAEPGDRALLLCPPGLDYVAALFGCFYAGLVAVPAYPPMTADVDERLNLLFANSGPRVVLTTKLLAPLCEASGVTRLAQNAGAVTVAVDSIAAVNPEHDLPRPSPPGDLALLQYTSGSTGAPRGVMLSNANILGNVGAILSHTDTDTSGRADSGVFWLPPYHDMGLIGGIFTPVVLGTETTLMSPLTFLADPVLWLEAITKYRGTFSAAPNFAYDLCVRKAEDSRIAALDLESWRIAINGAEPVQQATITRFAERFEQAGFRRTSFMPCYGLAEATLLVAGIRVGPTGAEPGRSEEPRRLPPNGVASVGTPIDDALVLVVDPAAARRCEDGEIGEIWCQGPCVAKGYWNNEQESGATFKGVLSDDGNNGVFLQTGDLGMLRDGELYVTGRSKDVIIVRGQNYYPHDIEHTAAQADARLRAGCIAAFDVAGDNGQKIVLVAESVADRDAGAVEEIAGNVRRYVAQEHGVSIDELVLIRRGDSLKTSSGKIRRGPTRAAYLGGKLTTAAIHRVARSSAPPSTAIADSGLEGGLATAMAEVLGIAAVSPTDDFFALGADSANVVELAVAAEAHGAMVESQDIYRFPTARLLSQEVCRVQSLSRGGRPTRSARNDILRGLIPRIADADTYSLSPVQRRWATDYLGDRTKTWGNLSLRLSLPDSGDITALRTAVAAVWSAHEALRTVFPEIDGELRQQILPSVAIPVSAHDHSEMSAASRVVATNEVAAAEGGTVFDLAVGPAARVALVRGSTSAEAILTVHHMLADGWSLMELRRELLRAYDEAVKGVAPRIEAPAIRYRDYATWMTSLSEGGLLSEAKRYWLGELDGRLPQTMPVDEEVARSDDTGGASTLVVVPSDLVTSLRRLATEARFSVSALLFGAFFSAVQERTQARDLIIGTPLAGRDRKDIKNVIGMFINLVPIRLQFQPGWDLKDVIAATQDKLLGAASHQWYQLDDMVSELAIEREPHQFPITNTFFTKIAMGSQTIGPQPGAVTSSALSTDVRYQMMLYAYDFADGLILDCRYRKALFDSDDVASLMEQYIAGLGKAVR